MTLMESTAISIGQKMPRFSLKDTSGKSNTLSSTMGKNGLLIAFTCNHCPYAIAVWPRLIELSSIAKQLGINTVAINPNINPAYPDDSPASMSLKVMEWNIPFPYLIDETQTVAKEYEAQCTPDIFLLTSKQTLFYHGRIDNNWKNEDGIVTSQELKDAIIQLSQGTAPPENQLPTLGCSIKWR
jgi:peroxiredoxin